MNIERTVKARQLKKLALWVSATIAIAAVCVLYHTSPRARFPLEIGILFSVFASIIILFALGIPKYISDRSFSGRIIKMRAYTVIEIIGTVHKKSQERIHIEMTVECDNGKTAVHDERLPNTEYRINPYREGDRVYHIKGTDFSCRFPRGDTETKYEPISVICPLCGEIMPLGLTECVSCFHELPRDPNPQGES